MARKTRNTLQADFDELLSLGPTPEPTVQFSRKTKRVLVTYPFEEAVWSVSVPSADLEAVCERLTHLPNDDRIRLVVRLTDALIDQYATTPADGKRKPKARAGFLTEVKYAAAWAYEFICREGCKPEQDRHPALRRAIDDLRRLERREVDDQVSRRQWAIHLTAHLVLTAYESEWRTHELRDPFEAQDFGYESFFETYIKPFLTIIKQNLDDPQSFERSARLRDLLTPWS